MKQLVTLKDIATHSKGAQINGDELIDGAEFDYLNGGINPSGKWNEANCEANTITISEGGNSCGYVNFMSKPFWCGAHCYYLYDTIDNTKYLYYALKSQQDRIMKLRSGACMPNIKKGDLGNFEFYYDDDVNEQDKVTLVLSKLENVIEARKQELIALDDLTKARFVELFGEGLKDDGKYPLLPVEVIGKVVSGATPKTANEEFWDGDNLWITPAELSEESFIVYDSVRKITDEGVKSCAVNLLPVGTVILSSRAPIGKVAIAGAPMYCNQGFKNIIPNEKINSIYLYELLSMETEYLNSLGRGATFKEISKKIVENIKVKVPPTELQEQFADFVKQVDKSKVVVQK